MAGERQRQGKKHRGRDELVFAPPPHIEWRLRNFSQVVSAALRNFSQEVGWDS
jgi:hypothetical protein